MTLRLPPLHVVFPPNAIYRQYPLPPDLKETWEILHGLAWVNQYAMTPPASLDELLAFHHDLKRRALEYRLQRLAATGWLAIVRQSGKSNIYQTLVPSDEPVDYSVQMAVPCGEPTSVRGVSPEELAWNMAGSQSTSEGEGTLPVTPAMGCTPFSSTVVVVPDPALREKQQQQQGLRATPATDCTPAMGCTPFSSTVVVVPDPALREKQQQQQVLRATPATDCTPGRTREEVARIEDCLIDLGIDDSAFATMLKDAWLTLERAEDWVAHKWAAGERLGGGFYRLQIRDHHGSGYVMRPRERAQYHRENDERYDRETPPVALSEAACG